MAEKVSNGEHNVKVMPVSYKKVSREVPVAERLIEFSKDDFNENEPLCTYPNITQRILDRFAESALVFTDGVDILQYANEYPIVAYVCDESICYADIMPEPRLNSFVLNIVVSTGVDGKRYSVSSGKMEEEITGFDTIVYYEDPVGVKHHIVQHDICKFLLKKPKLVISEEGILVFYTEDEILATVDCQQYAWVRWDEILENCDTIESICATSEACEITLVEGEDTLDAFGDVVEKAPRHVLNLTFDIKVADHSMLNPKLYKVVK